MVATKKASNLEGGEILDKRESMKRDAIKLGELRCNQRKLEGEYHRNEKAIDQAKKEKNEFRDYLRDKYKKTLTKEEGDYMESIEDEEKKKCKERLGF